MPAYLGGRYQMAGMKWYGSNVENKEKGLPRSILMMILSDKDTGAPLSFMSANLEALIVPVAFRVSEQNILPERTPKQLRSSDRALWEKHHSAHLSVYARILIR